MGSIFPTYFYSSNVKFLLGLKKNSVCNLLEEKQLTAFKLILLNSGDIQSLQCSIATDLIYFRMA